MNHTEWREVAIYKASTNSFEVGGQYCEAAFGYIYTRRCSITDTFPDACTKRLESLFTETGGLRLNRPSLGGPWNRVTKC